MYGSDYETQSNFTKIGDLFSWMLVIFERVELCEDRKKSDS